MRKQIRALVMTAAIVMSASLSWGMNIDTSATLSNISITGTGLTNGAFSGQAFLWSSVNGSLADTNVASGNGTFANGGTDGSFSNNSQYTGLNGAVTATQTQVFTMDGTTGDLGSFGIGTEVVASSNTITDSVWSGALGTMSLTMNSPSIQQAVLALNYIVNVLAWYDPTTDAAHVGKGGANYWVSVNGQEVYRSGWLGGVFANTSVLSNMTEITPTYISGSGNYDGSNSNILLSLIAGDNTIDITTYAEAIVPEPGTFILLGAGLGGLVLLRRRARKQ